MDGFAVLGGRRFSGLADVTSDLGALETRGSWVVVLPFSGDPVCARFLSVAAADDPPGRWRGPPIEAWSSSMDAVQHGRAVASIRELIAAGDVYQVNLCRRLSVPWPGADGLDELGAVLALGHPGRFAATVVLPAQGVAMASASPELFLRRRGSRVESGPVKGTASSVGGFLPKDRAENVMIVDLVRNDLGRVCEYGSVEAPDICRVEAHPGLFHLVSTVRGRLRCGVGWPELLGATFPPGSVTGAPKLAALDVIDRLEPVPRGIYCGAVGWVDADQGMGELGVAIRTFWLEGGELCYGTGGAVTWDSTPEQEWAETELKAKRALALATGEQPVFTS